MLIKRFFAIVLTLTILLSFPISTRASNWMLVLHDNDDVRTNADIKSIHFKDDGNKWSFKAESYCCWELNTLKLSFTIFINFSGSKKRQESDYFLEVQAAGPFEYKAFLYNLTSNEFVETWCDFKPNDPIGIISVNKNLLKFPNPKFSISAFTFNLDRPGTYVDAAPDDQNMVPFEFTPDPPKEILEVSTQEINLGELKIPKIAQCSFQLSNLGISPIDVKISCSSNLITDLEQLTMGEYGEQKITVTIYTSSLQPKQYIEKVSISSNLGNSEVLIKFELVPSPFIKVSPARIDFGACLNGDQKSEKIILSNQFKGRIQGKISTFLQWVGLSITTFDTTTEQELIVTLNATNLPAKEYTGDIIITSDGGIYNLSVHLVIIDDIIMDKKEIDFGMVDLDAPAKSPLLLGITNNTDKTLLLDFTKSDDWFDLSYPDMRIQPSDKKYIQIKLIPAKMKEAKKYQGTLTIDAPFNVYKITITANVSQMPPLIEWKSEIPNQKEINNKINQGSAWEDFVIISNQGRGILTGNAKWELANTDFRLFNFKFSLKQGETQKLKIKFDSNGVKLGVYQNKLLIESNGGNLVIPCTVEVIPATGKWIVIQLFIGNTIALINDESIKLDSPPYIKQATTMVPLRFISEGFKAKTEWFSTGKGRILITLGSKQIMLEIGKQIAYVNGDSITLQATPEIRNGRTFVPVRFIAEAFGASVSWISAEQKILIKLQGDGGTDNKLSNNHVTRLCEREE